MDLAINEIQKKKVKIVRILFIVLALAIVALSANWQIFDSEKYIAIANERYKDIKLPSIRGSILAKDGSTLAFSEPRYNVFIWLPEIQSAESRGDQTRNEFYSKVSTILEIPEEELKAKFETKALWIKIGTKISLEAKNALLDLKSDISG